MDFLVSSFGPESYCKMCKNETVMKNLAKEGIMQVWIIIYTVGSCWAISKRPYDEELREVDIM